MLPASVERISAYHREIVARLQAILAADLLGVYAGGSLAMGDFDAGRSDLDVAAVCRRGLARPTKTAIVEALRHESLPCPVRGLEFVLYREQAVRTPAIDADFELNLNTGSGMDFRADFEPGEERHWFAIDRSILSAHGKALFGPPADEVFAAIPRRPLLGVVAESVRWFREAGAAGSDAVLNACRALRFATEGVWSSKGAAGEWALERGRRPELVAEALAARNSQRGLDPVRVRDFLKTVEAEIASAEAVQS